MLGIVLLSLLGIGATAALAFDVFDDDDDARPAPDTPGGEMPDTGGPGPLPEGSDDILSGTNGADRITGTNLVDFIDARGGDDVVRGLEGTDIVDAGAGNDRVFGDEDGDVIAGGAGDDFLRGGSGDDILVDSDGADTLRGDTGDDVILSTGITDQSAFIDALRTVAGDLAMGNDPSLDELPGLDLSQDNDTRGDVVDGGRGEDVIFFGQDDTVTGGDGADLLVAGDTITKGEPAVITDFDVDEDVLILASDALVQPTLGVADEDGDAVVRLDGEVAVILQGIGATFTINNVGLLSMGA